MQYYGSLYFIQPFFSQVYFGADSSVSNSIILPPSAQYMYGDYFYPYYNNSDYYDLRSYTLPAIPTTFSGLYNNSNFDFAPYDNSDFWSLAAYDPAEFFGIALYSPLSGTTVSIGINPYVIFSSTPISGLINFTLRDSGNNIVPATVNFNPVTNEEILVPNSLLTYNANYTASITATGTNGNVVNFSWLFLTAASSIPVTSHHLTMILPGKLFTPQRNLVVNTHNIRQVRIYY